MRKVLFVATVADKHIKSFHLPYLEWLKKNGFEVHVSARNDLYPNPLEIPYCDVFIDTSFDRNPFSINNFKAYRKLINLIETYNYSFIHTHTPIASAIVRIIKVKRKFRNIKIIYTAHGFHFYKGSSVINWIIYYPLEKILSKFTNVLITINSEDYQLTKQKKFKAGKIIKTNGIGINLNNYGVQIDNRNNIRKQIGFNEEDFILIYPAELNKNKNQELLIDAMEQISINLPQIKVILLGTGDKEEYYRDLVNKKKLNKNVHFAGYVNNVNDYLNVADILVATSIREGLPLNIIEAMACGLPVIATSNRGHNELIKNNINGFLLKSNTAEELSEKIESVYYNKSWREIIKHNNLSTVNKYSLKPILKEVSKIYLELSK